MDVVPASGWYAVRCHFEWRGPGRRKAHVYEERITLWRAGSADEAIEKAEAEAMEYLDAEDAAPPLAVHQYLSLAQAYQLADEPGDGAEVYSLLRDSDLRPEEYLTRHFDTGEEHQGQID